MKKGILMLLLAGFSAAVSAQSITAGVKAGGQITNYTHTTNSKAALNWHAGGFASLRVAPKWSVKVEALLSTQGIKSENGEYKDQTVYLLFPAMAVYEPMDKLSVEAGFQGSSLLSAKLRFLDEGGSSDRKYKYEGGDWSLVFGAGYEVMDRLTLSMRMNMGISQFHKQAVDSRQQVFQVSAAYAIGRW